MSVLPDSTWIYPRKWRSGFRMCPGGPEGDSRPIIPPGMSIWTKILGAAVLAGTMGLVSCQGLLATIQAAH